MANIPLHRIAVVRPWAQFLSEVGAPVERGFRRASLPIRAMEDVNNFVPSHRFWKFVVDMAQKEHMEDLGFRVGNSSGANSADPRLSAMLGGSSTLFQGVGKACELINKTVSNCRVGLIHSRRYSHTYFYHSPSCNADNPAIEHIGWFGLMTLIGMVRAYAGRNWNPTEIGVMTRRPPCRQIREHFPITRLRLSQPYSYIVFPDSLLSVPPITSRTAATAPPPIDFEAYPDSFVDSFRKLLAAYVGEPGLSVGFAAALCDTGPRTLQRNLRKSGTTYSEALDDARFNVASRMLKDPYPSIADIAHTLGYGNPTHFSRAFRRIAGVSPRIYRNGHRLHE